MKKRRCDFMTAEKLTEKFSIFCNNENCDTCRFGGPVIDKTDCKFKFALEKAEVFNSLEWANEIYKTFSRDVPAECEIKYNVTHVYIFDEHGRVTKMGSAICSKKDRFDMRIGVAIAYCRAKGLKIPTEIFE